VQVGLNQWWNPLKREHRLETWRIWAGQQQCGRRSSRRPTPVGRKAGRPEATEKACGVSVAKAAGEKLGTTPVDRS